MVLSYIYSKADGMGEAKIHRLDGQRPGGDQEEIVKVAERLLEMAKGGHLRTIAYACTTQSGQIKTGWSLGEDSRWAETLGAACALAQDLGPGGSE